MAAQYQDLNFDEGDDFPYNLTLVDGSSDPIDLTGYTFYMTLKKDKSDSDAQSIYKKTITSIPSPTLGVVSITIDRADTLNITPGIYPYDIKFKTAGGDVRTVLRGNYNLVQGVTDSVA